MSDAQPLTPPPRRAVIFTRPVWQSMLPETFMRQHVTTICITDDQGRPQLMAIDDQPYLFSSPQEAQSRHDACVHLTGKHLSVIG